MIIFKILELIFNYSLGDIRSKIYNNNHPMKKSAFYDHKQVEQQWQKQWEELAFFQHTADQSLSAADFATKIYLLFAFAYPSGSGLHVGHVESKTALDILARFYRMNKRQVFFPVGWDAFGLPAENYAIKTGVHPEKTTKDAIHTFRRQLKRIGISYDWSGEIATCHPGYYKWTQWIFLQLFQAGLAYQALGKVNWCPSCQTVLANEQVVNGHCERCGTQVVQKDMKQWYFKITHYQDELISGLDQVDWPTPTKQQQLNWIGKKTGISIDYSIAGSDEKVTCFTTRPDTNFGATFVVLAPEHPLSQKLAQENQSISDYLAKASKKSELERQSEGRKKSGVFTNLYAVNNLTGRKMPVWISDFVLGGFGTGAVVGVPGHDKRDFEFAQFVNNSGFDHRIEVIRVVTGKDGDSSAITSLSQVQEETGVMVNSDFLNGLDINSATEKIIQHLINKGWGQKVTTYKLRDWLISRQRYWGAPIPIVYDPEGQPHPVKEEHLPWKLPTDVDFKPTGESPLKSSQEFIERTEKLYGKGWKPEFDTMDTFVDSSWYYLRYTDPRNESEFASKSQLEKWLPVDFYMIGPEHIVLHLLYARFFTKFLKDQGYLKFDEPFIKMRHQGMILGPDGKKMSKSKGNVINPDEIVEKFGADTLRVYEMFMGPIDTDKPWDPSSVAGVYRFLQRIYRLVIDTKTSSSETSQANQVKRKLHQTIKKVSEDVPQLKFNTAISSLMELVNIWEDVNKSEDNCALSVSEVTMFLQLLAPFAPFLTEELFQMLKDPKTRNLKTEPKIKNDQSIHFSNWPKWDQSLVKEDNVVIPIQINGKRRSQIRVAAQDLDNQELVVKMAIDDEIVAKWISGKEVKKHVYISGKILNLVV